MILSALIPLSVLLTAPAASPEPLCVFDKAAVLALSPQAFDQDMNGGWRTLASKQACWTEAADLLAAYRDARWDRLRPNELHINYWHEGQMRAMIGQNERAVGLLMAGGGPTSTGGFADYALGTIAFLNRDREALKSARARLAARPEPADFKAQRANFKSKFNVDLRWPLNLDVLDGLIKCFDKPYSVAYGDSCRPE